MNDALPEKDFEDNNPEEEKSNGRERPEDRFRRLIAADFDEDEAAEGDDIHVEAEDTPQAEEAVPLDKHPTGTTDKTGGWYSELDEEYLDHLQQTQVPELDRDTLKEDISIDRHPTGAPEQTGGWYYDDAGKPVASTLSMPVTPEEPAQPEQKDENLDAFNLDASTMPPEQEQKPPVSKPLVPMQVDEMDADATQVTPAAYRPAISERKPLSKPRPRFAKEIEPEPVVPTPVNMGPDTESLRTSHKGGNKNMAGCLARLGIIFLFIGIFIAVVFFSFGIYKYFAIVNADDFPDVRNLYSNASQFETTTILDRNGNTLYEIVDPQAGRRTYVRLDQIFGAGVEVGLRRGFYTIRQTGKIDLIQIQFKDFIFGIQACDLSRQHNFALLAFHRLLVALFRAQQQNARQLLGDCRCTRNGLT